MPNFVYYPQTWLWVKMLFGLLPCGQPCYSTLLAKKYGTHVGIIISIIETAAIYRGVIISQAMYERT